MNTKDLRVHQWPSLAESWLIAELRANAAQPVASVWDASRLAEQIEPALQIKKSKRTWERFLANLPFLEVTTNASEIRDDTGRPARALVINQLMREAQRARRPVHFFEIHHFQDFSVLVTSTTKGKKTWLSINKKINKSETYEIIFNQIAGGNGLLVPNKESVGWLRDVQRAVRKGTTQKGLSSITASWFDSLIAFHDPFTEPESGEVNQAESEWSQSSSIEGKHPRNNRRMIEEQSMSNANMKASLSVTPLSHLDRLEAESIHIMREVMAHAENPVMLYSIGKDSSVMLHLARKAFFPSTPPFPLLHVDTRWKFRAMYEFREKMAQESGMEL
ncbi:MAG: phosphoadenosine phosphosulfate reductase family protein, partial [Betaproteobacteria bacterium]